MADDLSVIAHGLGQLGSEDGFTRMLAALVGASHEFIGIADLEGNGLFLNEAGRRLVGLPDHVTVQSTRVIDYFAADDRDKVTQKVLPAARNNGFWEGELKFRNFATGATIPVLYNIFPLRDSSGAIVAYGTVTRDLSESKLADERSHWLSSIVESSDDAIVSKSLNGIIATWNKGAERIFGYPAEEAIGRPITIVIPEDRQNEETEILRRIRGGERIDHFETIRRRKDGRLIAISLTVSPVKNAEGEIIGASKIARDITEQKQSQEQIATLAREVEHRGKNLLASVQAIVNLSQSDSPKGLKEAIEGRIQALANVQSLFVDSRWVGADLSAIVARELAPYGAPDQKRVRIDGPAILLEPAAAQAVAITLHEFATNAAKYGSLSVPEGRVDLMWRRAPDGELTLRWAEAGGPQVQEPSVQGFGSKIIKQMIGQLHGEARFDWNPQGLVCEMTVRA